MFTGAIFSSNRRALQAVVVFVIFLLSFSIPVYILYRFIQGGSDPGNPETVVQADSFLPGARLVKSSGTFLSVQDEDTLDVGAEGNFLLGIWLKPRRLPREGEKVTFLAKLEGDYVTRRGYTLSLLREEGAIIPVVWWQDSSGDGGAYRFARMEIIADRWVFIALTLQNGRFLGVHGAVVLNPAVVPEIELLGGYELDPPVYPKSSANLLLGARGEGGYRGFLGPLFISHKSIAADELGRLLSEVVQNPNDLPGTLRGKELALWVSDDASDLSDSNQVVTFNEGPGREKGRKGEKKKRMRSHKQESG